MAKQYTEHDWNTMLRVLGELEESGRLHDSYAYKKLKQEIKQITGTSKIRTLDPLDYSGKTKRGVKSDREKLYKVAHKFTTSLTSTETGIAKAYENAIASSHKLGVKVGMEDEFFELIKKFREKYGDTMTTANSTAVVGSMVEVSQSHTSYQLKNAYLKKLFEMAEEDGHTFEDFIDLGKKYRDKNL